MSELNSIDVSVCIPTYNNIKNLKTVIDSVLIQKDITYEIIVSDDSTIPDVKYLIDEYISNGSAITYFHNNPFLGSPKNWNNVIKKSKGKYIKILHHDDWFQNEFALYQMVRLVDGSNKRFVFSAADSIQQGKRIEHIPDLKYNIGYNKNPLKLLVGNMIGGPSAVLFPRSANILFDENLIWLVDVDFYLNLYFKGYRSIYTSDKLYCTFMDENNITNRCIKDKDLNLRELSIIFHKYSKKISFKNKILMTIYIHRYLKPHFRISYLNTVLALLRFQ